jgi:hypothetical protein
VKKIEQISQPHLSIFGTATPKNYYSALSGQMLEGGCKCETTFYTNSIVACRAVGEAGDSPNNLCLCCRRYIARMIVLDAGKRPKGQDTNPPDCIVEHERIIDAAKWRYAFDPGGGNLSHINPTPHDVPFDDSARDVLRDCRVWTEDEYSKSEEQGDCIAMTVWGRAAEMKFKTKRREKEIFAPQTNSSRVNNYNDADESKEKVNAISTLQQIRLTKHTLPQGQQAIQEQQGQSVALGSNPQKFPLTQKFCYNTKSFY